MKKLWVCLLSVRRITGGHQATSTLSRKVGCFERAHLLQVLMQG